MIAAFRAARGSESRAIAGGLFEWGGGTEPDRLHLNRKRSKNITPFSLTDDQPAEAKTIIDKMSGSHEIQEGD